MALAAMLALPASAMAAAQFSIDDSAITGNLPNTPASPGIGDQGLPADGPSSLQAGSYPGAGTYMSFYWGDPDLPPTVPPTDDVKNAISNFGAGLLANPQSRPQCPQADLAAGGKNCPAGSLIGTSRFEIGASASGTTALAFRGLLYNSVPDAGKPGQLATITVLSEAGYALPSPPPAAYSYLPIPFEVTKRGNRDYGLTGTTGDITRPSPVCGGDCVATNLSFFADAGFTRNPTSCDINETTSSAVGYDNADIVQGPNYYFTPTGCESVPFNPGISMEIGDKDSVKTQQFPPVTVKITNQDNNADIKGNVINLPIELNSNNPNYKLCTQAQADADSCPADSKFGTTTATSPFLASALSGNVYLIQQSSGSLPGLLLDLNGLAHVKIQTQSFLGANNQQIVSVVTKAPQLPVKELTVNLNGGKTTGVFQNRSDLCFEDDSTAKFKSYSDVAAFEGWNGAYTGFSYGAKINGCPPGASGSMSKAQTSKPQLKLLTERFPTAVNMKEVEYSLPSGMKLSKKYFKKATGTISANLTRSQIKYVNSRKFKVTGLPSAGAAVLKVTLKNKAISLSKSKRKSLNKGKTLKFKINETATPVSGDKLSNYATVTVKGKKK